MKSNLDEIHLQYPLPENWSFPEPFSDQFQLENFSMKIVGLMSSSTPGSSSVTGSAGDFHDQDALNRAYFELIERISIINALEKDDRKLFPPEPEPTRWKYSKSNGIALHRNFEQASQGACLELVERDTILRAWYEGRRIKKLEAPDNPFPNFYDIEAFLFSSSIPVVGTFCFPKNTEEYPFVFGFGANITQSQALYHSTREAFQRLAFLWGEELPTQIPPPAVTPDYHLEYFLVPKNIQTLRNWLNRCLESKNEPKNYESFDQFYKQTTFHDISPNHLHQRLHVVKAIHPEVIPLTFGQIHPQYPGCLVPHPIA